MTLSETDTYNKPETKFRKKPKCGWLKRPERKERRENALTLTDQDVQEMINKIDEFDYYISESLYNKNNQDTDRYMRTRDKAMIGLNWIFFKRASEILKIRLKDVTITETKLSVTFWISKKVKRFRFCPNCTTKGKATKNGFTSQFCKKCASPLPDVTIKEIGKLTPRTKHKSTQNPFVKYVSAWHKIVHSLTNNPDGWFFPTLQTFFGTPYFDFEKEKPMSYHNYNLILQKIDSSMTSSFFRYGASEKYLALGYSPSELRDIGSWASSKMPEEYAKKIGQSIADKRWSNDPR